jgi:hypothetical protein
MAYIMVTYINNKGEFINQEKLFTLLKNNEISMLHTFGYTDSNYYDQLLKLLKINRSVTRLWIKYNGYSNNGKQNSNQNKFYKLICDYLINTTDLKLINFIDYGISVENSMLLSNAFKQNNSLNEIHLYNKHLDKSACTYFINSLKFNKTITTLTTDICSIDGNHIAELLKVNTSLTSISVYVEKVTNIRVIDNALKNNKYIEYIYTNFKQDMYKNISTYCDRNKHNNKLRSTMIEDL